MPRPATESTPCPVCRKADGCLISHDGRSVSCRHLLPGVALGGDPWAGVPPELRIQSDATPEAGRWAAEASRYAAALTDAHRAWIDARLGLPPGALARYPLLGCSGVTPDGPIITFPEVDPHGRVTGIVARHPGPAGDEKRALPGSKRGLSVPAGWQDQPGTVYVVEGASDAAALVAAGRCAVGRPSKTGGLRLLQPLFATWGRDRRVCLVGENDSVLSGDSESAQGQARKLARLLGRDVHWGLPP